MSDNIDEDIAYQADRWHAHSRRPWQMPDDSGDKEAVLVKPPQAGLLPIEEWTSPNPLEPVRSVFKEAYDLALVKNEAYGNSWAKRGYMANVARIMEKVDRLQSMMWQDESDMEAAGESIEDTLVDLCNSAAFTLINVRKGNRWGE